MSDNAVEVAVEPELVKSWIREIGSEPSAAVPLLQAIQGRYGYLPRAALDLVVENTAISASQLYGVATFYAQFRLKPVGRHLIKVCHGTACHVRGANRIDTALGQLLKMKGGEDTASDGSYTVAEVACLGCCSLAPVMVIGDRTFGNLTGAEAQRCLRRHAQEHGETLPERAGADPRARKAVK